MPRLTPLRFLNICLLLWLTLLGTWIFLPSPPIPTHFRSAHIQHVLTSSHKLTTVHELTPSFLHDGIKQQHQRGEGANFVLDWRLVPYSFSSSSGASSHDNDDRIVLELGSPDNRGHVTTIDLSEAAAASARYLSDVFTITVPTGDRNHIINLPWFDEADATIFHTHMHGFDDQIFVRLYTPKAGRVEVWKAGSSMMVDDTELREEGVVAVFDNIPAKGSAKFGLGEMKVEEMKGRLLSRTFWIREIIITNKIMAATPTVVLFLVEAALWPALCYLAMVMGPVVAVYVVVVVVVWICLGRPAFANWVRTSVLTRWLVRRKDVGKRTVAVWGPTGLVYHRSEVGEDSNGGLSAEDRRASAGGGFDAIFKSARSRQRRSVDLESMNNSLAKT